MNGSLFVDFNLTLGGSMHNLEGHSFFFIIIFFCVLCKCLINLHVENDLCFIYFTKIIIFRTILFYSGSPIQLVYGVTMTTTGRL